MLLTITSATEPATDLGFLLHKHPDQVQSFVLPFGTGHVFYPQVSRTRCTAALLLDVDPVGLVRGKTGGEISQAQYVNDRPYVASSMLSVALSRVFGTALRGRCRARPELVGQALSLEASLAVLPSDGGEPLIRCLFEPLGYQVSVTGELLDEEFPEWGESPYYMVTLAGTLPLQELLGHLYVLIPVLDNHKHYYIGEDEVTKLLQYGEGWLSTHPERELITWRYLKRSRHLAIAAKGQLIAEDDVEEDSAPIADPMPSLQEQRLLTVVDVLKRHGARRVLDLGCGEGRLLRYLLEDPAFLEVVGMDVSPLALERARERLHLDHLPSHHEGKVTLLQGSLNYRDRRLEGFDGAALVEVIEHLDPSRLPIFERVLFEFTRPRVIVVTTPNAEYNVLYPGLKAGAMRHADHQFEWSRRQFADWVLATGASYGYRVEMAEVGPEDSVIGSPTQMGVFIRDDS